MNSTKTQVDYVRSNNIAAVGTTNYSDVKAEGFNGVIALIDVSAIDAASGDESYVFTIQGKDELSGNYYTLLASTNLRAGGVQTVALQVHPDLTESANLKASQLLPTKIRVKLVVGGTTPSITFSVNLILTA